jgi:hypothetical protein
MIWPCMPLPRLGWAFLGVAIGDDSSKAAPVNGEIWRLVPGSARP